MTSKSTFGFNQPSDSPGFLLWQTTITWQRKIRTLLESYDISHPQFVIMALLLWHHEQEESVNQVTISKMLKLDKMTVSTSLKKLATQGYVARQDSQIDTRAKCVTLTIGGKKLIQELVPVIEQLDAVFFRGISKEDQQKFTGILGQLISDEIPI